MVNDCWVVTTADLSTVIRSGRDDTAGAADRFSAAPTALGSSSGIYFPALPGWADVRRPALRALHLQRSLPCHFSLDLPQASQLLEMTIQCERQVGFPKKGPRTFFGNLF